MRTQLFSSGMTVGGWLASAALALSISTVTHAATTIEGTPTTSVAVDRYYGFQSWATDTDGRTVTYSITNKPSWATFDTQYGHLYGVPPTSAGGTYAGIVISASDGVSQASLPAFTIEVTGGSSESGGSSGGSGSTGGSTSSGSGSATVNWQPPSQNTNGTSVSNLAGYTIYYGTSQSSYTSVKVANPGLTSYVISSLSPGTYYFVVTAYNNSGESSAYSAVASKTIN